MPQSFSWGYNPALPFAVESALDGPQGLQRLVKAAHAHGIAVILDVVYNHFGPGDLDLWRFDGWSDADHDALYRRYGDDAFHRVIYTESHDEIANGHQRVPSEIWSDNPASYFAKKRSTLGAALVFTAPGIPMIFQGQEFLEDEYFRDEDPLDWTKRERFAGIHQLYQDLIRLRRNWHNHTRGLRGQNLHVFHVNNEDKVMAFHRWQDGGPGDDVVVVLNFANRAYDNDTLGFPRPGNWRLRFNSDWQGYDADFGGHPSFDTVAGGEGRDSLPCTGSVGLGPYTALILSQDS